MAAILSRPQCVKMCLDWSYEWESRNKAMSLFAECVALYIMGGGIISSFIAPKTELGDHAAQNTLVVAI